MGLILRKSSLSLLLSLAFLLSLALLLPLARADQELLDAVNVGDIAHVRRHLEELGKDPNHHDPWEKSVLIHASYNGHADIVELLIEKGADVNARSKHSGRTPLIAAAYHGNVEALAVLLAHGADVNVQDKRHKYTALHHAINEIRNDQILRECRIQTRPESGVRRGPETPRNLEPQIYVLGIALTAHDSSNCP